MGKLRFLVNFFAVPAHVRLNWLNFKFTSLRERQGDKFYHGRLGIIPKKFEMMRSLFYKDVFTDRIV